MTSFQNQGDVGNQAGTQKIAGSVYNNPIIYESPHTSASRRPPVNYSADSDAHDNDILASLAFPQMLVRRKDIEPPHENTCQWVLKLDEYRDWIEAPRGLLWIKGKPGAGKSTLMSFLYTTWESQCQVGSGLRLDFFFSARGSELQRTPLGMIRSLVNQIFRQDEGVRSLIRQKYLDNCATYGHTHASWEWQRQELQTLFSTAVLDSAQRQQVMLFIDALDEAGEQSAREIARYLHQVNDKGFSHSASVKICISCRHYPVPTALCTTEIWVENHNGADISAFIGDRLDDSLAYNGMSYVERHDLISSLITRAKGVFQWAFLVVPVIEKRIYDGESPKDLHEWLQQIPQELGDVYERIFRDVVEPRNRPQSFLLFQWVCLAARPISLTELRYAMVAKDASPPPAQVQCQDVRDFVRNDERMKQRVQALSGGLLEISSDSSNNGVVQVIHQSVNDYILDQGLVLLESLQSETSSSISAMEKGLSRTEVIGRCQARMYWSCLKYVASEAIQPPEIPLEMLHTKEAEKFRIQFCQKRPWIAYAVCNLLFHAEKAGRYRREDLEHQIELLQTVMPIWRAAYQVLDLYGYQQGLFDPKTSLLHIAAAANMTDVVDRLLPVPIHFSVKDWGRRTAAHLAARHGHVEVLEMLSHKGAALNVMEKEGTTPFMVAAGHGQSLIIRWFIGRPTSIKETTVDLDEALRVAARSGGTAVVRILLGEGASVNAKDWNLGNVLQAACYRGHEGVVQLLLQQGADVNAQGGKYGNALQAACCSGHNEVVRLLLQHGADVNSQGGYFGNALQAACERGYEKPVQRLLQQGADVNAQGGHYGHALQAACEYGHEEVLLILLQHGADVNAQGRYGTPLDAASHKKFDEIVQILREHGGRHGHEMHLEYYADFYSSLELSDP